MASRYLMQIVDKKTGDVVQFEPGLAIEKDFVEDCARRIIQRATRNIVDRGVGIGCTTLHVEKDIEDGLDATVRDCIEKSIMSLKAKV